MAKTYFTTAKNGDTVEVDVELARQLIQSGKKKPEDFLIEESAQEPVKKEYISKPLDKSSISEDIGRAYQGAKIPLAGLTALASMALPSEGSRLERANEIIQNPDYNLATSISTSPLNYSLAAPIGILGQVTSKLAPVIGTNLSKAIAPIVENVLYSTADAALDPTRDVTAKEAGTVAALTGGLGLAGRIAKNIPYIKFLDEYINSINQGKIVQKEAQTQANKMGKIAQYDEPFILPKGVSENIDKMDLSAPSTLIGLGLGSSLGGLGSVAGGVLGHALSPYTTPMVKSILKSDVATAAIPFVSSSAKKLAPVSRPIITEVSKKYINKDNNKESIEEVISGLKKLASMKTDNAR